MINSLNLTSFVTLFSAILILPICFCSSDNLQWYDACGSKFTCGNVNAGFPFWGGSTRPSSSCGYPDFKLSCNDDNSTMIVMKNMTYHVLDVNQISKILRIVRHDFESQGLCLQELVNTTLNFEYFNYAQGSQNITVFYGCPVSQDTSGGYGPPTSSTVLPAQFNCRLNGFSSTLGSFQEGAAGPSGCHASVVVPVLESQVSEINDSSVGLRSVIDYGFQASYTLQDEALCLKCGASNGRCGFDVSTKKATCLCPDGTSGSYSCSSTRSKTSVNPVKKKIPETRIILVMSTGGGLVAVLLAFFFLRKKVLLACCFMIQYFTRTGAFNRRYSADSRDIEDFFKNCGSLAPKRYTYKVLKRITNSFEDKLGEGGYGTVYKGKLLNGRQVAIKLLKESKGNADDFKNEITSIGKTNHVNVVTLLGFCFEGRRRALVYDFMPNGSLEKFIYGKNDITLASDRLFNIAVGIARGLEYLHRGCNTRIVHFDIKPHNILLDENFCPKISDFGLAKSYQKDESIISMSGARGTVGFIAPELILKGFGSVSHKSDVYSYGMLVLEMVGCRQNGIAEALNSSEQYFPTWIYKQLEQSEEGDNQDILNGLEKGDLRKMILVSLWCIQTKPSNRPAMSRVVEMLEGPLDSVQIPPMSYLSLSSPQLSQPGFSTVVSLVMTNSP